ncbi:hypothetical protein BDF21DRAFT_397448 [Thamnidium elegans]|nr:hypothetical protein BDF21DRAFT_397448 [Thamnidium elegans]
MRVPGPHALLVPLLGWQKPPLVNTHDTIIRIKWPYSTAARSRQTKFTDSIFRGIVDVVLYNTHIEIGDGEIVSDTSRKMSIMNDYKLCGIEFRKNHKIQVCKQYLPGLVGVPVTTWYDYSSKKKSFVAQYISSMYISSSLLELNCFRTTLKYLFKWRNQLLKSSEEIRLALFQNKREYETIIISSPATPTVTPPLSSPLITTNK